MHCDDEVEEIHRINIQRLSQIRTGIELPQDLILRLAGDLFELTDLRAYSAIVTIIALVGYIAYLASARVP
jgi:hypothetical protein